MLRTFVAAAFGNRFGLARAVAQRRSDDAPGAFQPRPFGMGTGRNGEGEKKERA